MKKSQSIILTVIASMGMAAHAQQAAKAAATSAVTCGHGTAHATSRGGFGATGKGHSSGG